MNSIDYKVKIKKINKILEGFGGNEKLQYLEISKIIKDEKDKNE